eukprot:GCRY01002124.1.p1 GENE.GCRY01002124.1~~GCRY01002124.1.p1  ORF type:complete len:1101 (+),score=279.38 GCRY01002124.1:245-3547(+)
MEAQHFPICTSSQSPYILLGGDILKVFSKPRGLKKVSDCFLLAANDNVRGVRAVAWRHSLPEQKKQSLPIGTGSAAFKSSAPLLNTSSTNVLTSVPHVFAAGCENGNVVVGSFDQIKGLTIHHRFHPTHPRECTSVVWGGPKQSLLVATFPRVHSAPSLYIWQIGDEFEDSLNSSFGHQDFSDQEPLFQMCSGEAVRSAVFSPHTADPQLTVVCSDRHLRTITIKGGSADLNTLSLGEEGLGTVQVTHDPFHPTIIATRGAAGPILIWDLKHMLSPICRIGNTSSVFAHMCFDPLTSGALYTLVLNSTALQLWDLTVVVRYSAKALEHRQSLPLLKNEDGSPFTPSPPQPEEGIAVDSRAQSAEVSLQSPAFYVPSGSVVYAFTASHILPGVLVILHKKIDGENASPVVRQVIMGQPLALNPHPHGMFAFSSPRLVYSLSTSSSTEVDMSVDNTTAAPESLGRIWDPHRTWLEPTPTVSLKLADGTTDKEISDILPEMRKAALCGYGIDVARNYALVWHCLPHFHPIRRVWSWMNHMSLKVNTPIGPGQKTAPPPPDPHGRVRPQAPAKRTAGVYFLGVWQAISAFHPYIHLKDSATVTRTHPSSSPSSPSKSPHPSSSSAKAAGHTGPTRTPPTPLSLRGDSHFRHKGSSRAPAVSTVKEAGLDSIHIPAYEHPDRTFALRICGWPAGSDAAAIEKVIDRMIADQQYTRAAWQSLVYLGPRHAVVTIGRAIASCQGQDTESLALLGMVLASCSSTSHQTSADLRTLWRGLKHTADSYTVAILSMVSHPLSQAPHNSKSNKQRWPFQEILGQSTSTFSPHPKQPSSSSSPATSITAKSGAKTGEDAFLESEEQGLLDLEWIRPGRSITMMDRLGFALRFLDDQTLPVYLQCLMEAAIQHGRLDGLVLTGVNTAEGARLLQGYIDRTTDIQTVALVSAHALSTPPGEKDPVYFDRYRSFISTYRDLLDRWRLWSQRIQLDYFVRCHEVQARPPQVSVSCQWCSKPLSLSDKNSRTTASRGAPITPSACPHCRKPLPSCSICLLPLHYPSHNTTTPHSVDACFTWCQTCRHGGHASCLLRWFEEHTECPIPGCQCMCLACDM